MENLSNARRRRSERRSAAALHRSTNGAHPACARGRWARDVRVSGLPPGRHFLVAVSRFCTTARLFERYDDRAAVLLGFQPPHGPMPNFKRSRPQAVPTDPRAVTPIVDCSVGGVARTLSCRHRQLRTFDELRTCESARRRPSSERIKYAAWAATRHRSCAPGPLRVGNAVYPDAYYAVLTDLRRYGYDVVFGADIIASTGIEIDWGAHAIRFGTPVARSGIAVPFPSKTSFRSLTSDLATSKRACSGYGRRVEHQPCLRFLC